MMQSWGISRFNGQISRLQTVIEGAGTALARIRALHDRRDAPSVAARQDGGTLDQRCLSEMRMFLWATAVSALALLILMLL